MIKSAIIRATLAITLIIITQLSAVAKPIKLGMSTVLTGPSAALGNDMRVGIESYFQLVNKDGGVQNRQIEFIVRDDGYEPERAAKNMRTLIDKDDVLAVLGNVGTPTAIVSVPIAQEKKTLLFGAFSGGGVLRPTPANRYIINYRPSYAEETANMIQGLLNIGIKPREIAFFTQRDGYGDAAYRGAVETLHQHGFLQTEQLVHGRYTRNTLNVEDAVADVLNAAKTPKVIIMAGSYASSAKFIKLVKKVLPETWFVNVSFVGSDALQQALGKEVTHVITMQAVPELDSRLPLVNEYLDALQQFNASTTPNEVSLEGFIIAKIFHQGLLKINGDINKESIISGLESLNGVNIGLGHNIFLSKEEHQAIHTLWLVCLTKEGAAPFDWQMMLPHKEVQAPL